MQKDEIVARVNELLEPLIAAQGFALVDTEYAQAGKRAVLRLFVDKPGGITLDDCAAISNMAGELLDVHEVIRHSYTLEVSSPGLTRPLKKVEDYQRFAGRLVRLSRRHSTGGVDTLRGTLLGLQEGMVLLEVDSQVQRLPLSEIVRARLDPDL